MDLPTQFTKPDLSKLSVNDTVPSNIDTSTISYVGEFLPAPLTFPVSNSCTAANLWDGGNGEGLGFYSIPYTAGPQEWTTVETVIIRFDTSFTPSGRFPVYLNKSLADSNGVETSIGYDAAVCVQKYEPWIIEAYNTSTGFPSALRMVGKGNDSYPLPPSGSIRGAPIANTRYLNTTGKGTVFSVAHGNSVDRMWRIGFDQGKRWGNYTPPPTVGPVVPPHTTFFLTSTHSIGRRFHRRRWTSGVHRTLSRPVRHYPRTSRCDWRSTISCGVRTGRRTIVRGSDTRICHLRAVAIDRTPGAYLHSGNHGRRVRTNVTTRYSSERIRGL